MNCDPDSNDKTAAELRMCITCGRMGGVCRWVDDPVICMRKQIAHLLSVIRDYNPDDALFDHEKEMRNVG